MAKSAAAAIVALVGVAMYKLISTLGMGRMALAATLAAALASSLWTVASQSLWQHGPAALALTLSILLLTPHSTHRLRLRLFLAGFATAALVCFRLIDVIFAAVILIWVVRHHFGRVAWFLPVPIAAAAALIGYNYCYFGSVVGGQSQLEALHPELHRVCGAWSSNLLIGAAGTLISPSHGLLVFTPWIGVALATVPVVASKLRGSTLICWLLWAVIPYYLLLSKYAVWWGGHCFGPRYWTDVIPLFAVVLAFGLDWSWTRSRALFVTFVATLAFSFVVQSIGAFCYPSSWETVPVDVDGNHERLWDWRDTELTRCLAEGVK